MADDAARVTDSQSEGNKPAVTVSGREGSTDYLKRSAAGVLRWFGRLKLLDWIALALLSAVIIQIGEDYFGKPVIIDPIIVPKIFEDAGYTPRSFANRVRDQVEAINNEHFDGFEQLKQEQDRLSSDSSQLPDIEIPETGMSFSNVVDILERFLGVRPRHIYGEVQMVSEAAGVSSKNPAQQLKITIYDSKAGGRQQLSPSYRLTNGNEQQRIPFEDAVEIAAEDALRFIQPYNLAQHVFLKKHDPDEALALAQECHEPEGSFVRGEVSLYNQNYKDAIENFQRATENRADFSPAHWELSVALVNYAKMLADQKARDDPNILFKDALSELDRVKSDNYLNLRPEDKNLRQSFIYLAWADYLFAERLYDKAIEKYNQSIQSSVELKEDYIGLAKVYTREAEDMFARGDSLRANQQLEEAEKNNPNDPAEHQMHAKVLQKLRRYREANDEWTTYGRLSAVGWR
jgi:tetratricopeptide (TPR) repeat protein